MTQTGREGDLRGADEAALTGRVEPEASAASSRRAPGMQLPLIVAALDSEDAEERRQATARLAELDVDDALPLLLRGLGDADWRVRKEATISCQRIMQSALGEWGAARPAPSADAGPPSSAFGGPPSSSLAGPPSGAFGGPPSSAFGGPPSSAFGGPPSSSLAGPPSSAFGGPPSSAFGGPPSSAFGGPPSSWGAGPSSSSLEGPPSSAFGGPPSSAFGGPPLSRSLPAAARRIIDALIGALQSSEDVGLRNAVIDVLGQSGRPATPALIAALDGLDLDGRKLVIEALGRARDPVALDVLEKALWGQDINVRQAAIEAIASLGLVARQRVTSLLLRSLRDRDRFVRLTALNGLNVLEAPVPWNVLAPLIEDSMLRPAALVAAALAESPEAPRALVSALSSSRGAAFAQLVRGLTRLSEGPLGRHVEEALRAAPPLVFARLVQAATAAATTTSARLTEPPSLRGRVADAPSLRAQALLLAAMARAPGAAEAAVQAVLDPSMVEPAQRALSMLGADALPAMLAFIEREPDPDIWEGVDDASASLIDAAVVIAQGAAGAGSSPAVPWVELLSALRKAVRGSSTLVATSALYGLAKIGSDADLSLAAELTSAVSLPVARAAEVALSALAERHVGPARVFARRMMQREETYLPAVILLDTLDVAGPDELGFFSHVASSGNVRARRAAVLALATRAGALSLDVLSLALADEERDVRLAAALALGRLCAMLDGATGLVGDAAARARELLALVHASGDPDLVSAAAQGGASVERGSDFKPSRSGRPPGWYVP